MTQRIVVFNNEGTDVLGFDTGLDSRAFAQARLAGFISDSGLIVSANGKTEVWKPDGVCETPAGSLAIYGPAFSGRRLDLLIKGNSQDEALEALVCWMRALTHNSGTELPLLPFAALIADNDDILFCPENLASRCAEAEKTAGGFADIKVEGSNFADGKRYTHPDLKGEAAAAFTAAALLYRLLAGTAPFGADNEITLHQDMREGNFLPLRLAAPGIDEALAVLVDEALAAKAVNSSGVNVQSAETGKRLFEGLLEKLCPGRADTVQIAVLFRQLSAEESGRLLKEKERTVKQKNLGVKTRRFVMRNTAIIAGSIIAVLVAALIARSIIQNRADLPTTKGMDQPAVIHAYYSAFGELDHTLMEACLAKGAGKDDVNMVMNIFVISKVRQAYELNAKQLLINAAEWLAEGGGPVEAQVFGVTNLQTQRLSGSEETDGARWLARYTLWTPFQPEAAPAEGASAAEESPAAAPQAMQQVDTLTLERNKRGNWQITGIERQTP